MRPVNERVKPPQPVRGLFIYFLLLYRLKFDTGLNQGVKELDIRVPTSGMRDRFLATLTQVRRELSERSPSPPKVKSTRQEFYFVLFEYVFFLFLFLSKFFRSEYKSAWWTKYVYVTANSGEILISALDSSGTRMMDHSGFCISMMLLFS